MRAHAHVPTPPLRHRPDDIPTLTERQKESFVAQARCIRTHGVPGFPDPVFGPRGFGVRVPLKG